jgi:hypothetical protein
MTRHSFEWMKVFGKTLLVEIFEEIQTLHLDKSVLQVRVVLFQSSEFEASNDFSKKATFKKQAISKFIKSMVSCIVYFQNNKYVMMQIMGSTPR